MRDVEGLSWLWTEMAAFAKWFVAGLLGILLWFIKADRDGLMKRQSDQGDRIAALESSRPSRHELTDAIGGLRREIREDIADLKEDIGKRLDIIIDLHRHPPRRD